MVLLLLATIGLTVLPQANGHAGLIDPPSRNYLRKDPNWCAGISGGPRAVAERSSGKFPFPLGSYGLCGDPYAPGAGSLPPLKDQPYMKPGPPVASYQVDQVVEFTVEACAEHFGFYVFRVCDTGLDGSELRSPQEGENCLKRWTLKRAAPVDGELPIDELHPERWYVPNNAIKLRKARFVLPKGLRCPKCTLQWTYVSGNICSYDNDYANYCDKNSLRHPGKLCADIVAQGFAPETTWNCADITITGDGDDNDNDDDQTNPIDTEELEQRIEKLEAGAKTLESVEADVRLIKTMVEKYLEMNPPTRRRSPTRRRTTRRRTQRKER